MRRGPSVGRAAVLGVGAAACFAVAAMAAAQTAPWTSGTPTARTQRHARAKLATMVRVASQTTVRGHRPALVAMPVNALGVPLAHEPVRFEVRVGADVVATGVSNTDAHGRAKWYMSIPEVGAPLEYRVRARFPGDARYAASEHEARLRIAGGDASTVGHTGSLRFPEGPYVRITRRRGAVGFRTKLRAQVRNGSSPATAGRVWFWANGTPLGSAAVTEAGLATLSWTPSPDKLAHFRTNGRQQRYGPIQAWYEPPSGDDGAPALGIAPAFVATGSPCQWLGITDACTASTSAASTYAVVRWGVVTVRKYQAFGQGQVETTPRIRLAFASPSRPPPNPDCDASLISGDSTFCRRDCERLEYALFDEEGSLQRLQGNSDAGSCGWELVAEPRVSPQMLEIAYDACDTVAATHGRTVWNHQVSVVPRQLVSGVFKFRDPHVVQTSGGWRAQLRWESIIRSAQLGVPLKIHCR